MALNRKPVRAAAAVVLLGFLAACGNGAALSGLVGGAGNQGIDLNALSRQKIEAFGTPILRATLPARATDLLMSPRDVRKDVTTWEAAEGITFAFRNGILIESRGLGADLMSAAAPSPSQILGGGPYVRTYFFVADDDRNQRRDYTCTTELIGAEPVAVYGKTHQTRHVREVCTRDVGRIANDFWFEGNTLRKSRQWVGPDAGYAEFVRVVD
jgi:hypothetical protein